MKVLQIIAGVLLVVCVSGCKLGGGGGGGSASSGIAMVSSSSQSSEQGGNDVSYIAELANNTSDNQGSERQAPAAIPEPATMVTLGLGAAALIATAVRRNKSGGVR